VIRLEHFYDLMCIIVCMAERKSVSVFVMYISYPFGFVNSFWKVQV